jgi:hypothetical protein
VAELGGAGGDQSTQQVSVRLSWTCFAEYVGSPVLILPVPLDYKDLHCDWLVSVPLALPEVLHGTEAPVLQRLHLSAARFLWLQTGSLTSHYSLARIHLVLLSLAHLCRPIQPPKKPESAPFFLPTVASLAGNPVFDPSAAPAADESAQGPGDAAAAAGSGRTSQVLRKGASAGTGAAADALGLTPFVRLLRAGAEAGDYASFMAYLRTLTPAAVDREVRALQVGWGSAVGRGYSLYQVEDMMGLSLRPFLT